MKIVEIKSEDLIWNFGATTPSFKTVHQPEWDSTVSVCPTPCYPHPRQLVQDELWKLARYFPLRYPPTVYILSYETDKGTNGWAQADIDHSSKERDEHGRRPIAPAIMLMGKQIPIHPAMTRYLVAHEYGHVVEYNLARQFSSSDYPGTEFMRFYAELRKLPPQPKYYGPGTWHLDHREIFANDFRILVAGAEEEFWPHDCVHPTHLPELAEWWSSVQATNLWQIPVVSPRHGVQ